MLMNCSSSPFEFTEDCGLRAIIVNSREQIRALASLVRYDRRRLTKNLRRVGPVEVHVTLMPAGFELAL